MESKMGLWRLLSATDCYWAGYKKLTGLTWERYASLGRVIYKGLKGLNLGLKG